MDKEKKKKNQKKQEREAKRKQEIAEVQKELEELINNMNDMLGKNDNVKMVEFKIPTRKERVVSWVLNIIFSLVVLLSLTGFTNWLYYDYFIFVLAFLGIIVILESFLDWIIMFFFGKYVIYSFGALKLLAPIFAFIVSALVFPLVEIKSFWYLALVFILYCIVRKMFVSLFKKIFVNKPKINKR